MDLASSKEIRQIFERYHVTALKQLGQNFLVNKAVLDKIIKAADLKNTDTVLEIGPGIGILTQELAKNAKLVIAVEKDRKMPEILKETLFGFKNVKIIPGDILKTNLKSLGLKVGGYKLIANLPYYITSPIIRMFLEAKEKPSEIVFMVQKEVGQRICAKPPEMNLLAVSIQFYAIPKIINYVSKESFWPIPKVDSAIIKITPKQKLKENVDEKLFFQIIKAGFSQPRKQLANNLSKKLGLSKEKTTDWLNKNKILPEQRAETLSIENWINLTKSSLLFF